MLSVILNIVTITIVIILTMFVMMAFKKREKEPDVTPSDIMFDLTTGDRLKEIINEPITKLMSGSEGNFGPSEFYTALPTYMIT